MLVSTSLILPKVCAAATAGFEDLMNFHAGFKPECGCAAIFEVLCRSGQPPNEKHQLWHWKLHYQK